MPKQLHVCRATISFGIDLAARECPCIAAQAGKRAASRDWGLARQVDAEALYRLALAIRFPSYYQTPNPGPSGGDAD